MVKGKDLFPENDLNCSYTSVQIIKNLIKNLIKNQIKLNKVLIINLKNFGDPKVM